MAQYYGGVLMDGNIVLEVMTALAPWVGAAVAFTFSVIQWMVTRRDRIRKEESDRRDRELEKQSKETVDTLKDMRDVFLGLKGEVDSLATTVRNMQAVDTDVRTDIRRLERYYETNMQHTRQLGHLIMTLAEGLRDQHLDGSLTRAVNEFRRFEEGLYEKVMSYQLHDNNNSGI